MMRLLPFVLAIVLWMLPISTRAEMHEESIPAQDLAAPVQPDAPQTSPAASPSPAQETNPDTDSDDEDWETVRPGQARPNEREAPVAESPPPAPAVASSPAEVAPAVDVGSIATTPQISDASLAPLIDTAPTPARAASLRITERERVELDQGHTDQAIRELAHAISIDPSNSYAYFYLGRAYVARRDYGHAQTFFKRAQTGLASNSAWLGETYAFEGLSLEQAGKSADAAACYQKALTASPGNLTARVGVTRLSAFMPAAATAPAPAVDLEQPAPAEPAIAPPPEEAPVPLPPRSAPPPPAN